LNHMIRQLVSLVQNACSGPMIIWERVLQPGQW
jgi:hypothetical protein